MIALGLQVWWQTHGDAFGSAEYRRHLVKVLAKRALEEAMA